MSKEIEIYNPSDETVVIYRSADSAVQLDVQLADETVWLTQAQIALLFQKAKSTISYHITNIFKEGELDEKVVVRKIRITTPHGAMTLEYNTRNMLARRTLDYILSLGVFRVAQPKTAEKTSWLANDFRGAMQEMRDADAGKVQLKDAEELLNEL